MSGSAQPLQQAASQLDELHGDEETGPVRRCALTRDRRPKEELIRFVLGPDGTIVPDLKERLPGRGVWLTASKDCVAEAAKRNAFAAALKTKVSVPPGLAEQVDRLLAEAALKRFGPCQQGRSGGVRLRQDRGGHRQRRGYRPRCTPKRPARMAAASSTANFGRNRGIEGLAPSRAFSTDELGLASGRTNVIHAALIQGGAALALLAAASRLERYRKGTSAFAKPIGSDTDRT